MIYPEPIGPICSIATLLKRTTPTGPTSALFVAILVLAVFAFPQPAPAWVAAFSEGMTANATMGTEGLIAFVSIMITAISAVWLYLTQLVR
jgi:hypothetical protein